MVPALIGLLLLLPAASADPPPDEVHWQQVTALRERLLAVSPTEQTDQALEIREGLVSATRRYQQLYPGGRRNAEAVRLELQTMFELGMIRGGDLDALQTRCNTLLRTHPGARAEAAYWLMLCQRGTPTSAPVLRVPPGTIQAYQEYLRAYPDSIYAPRLVEVLFQEAESADALEAMRGLVSLLEQWHPDHLVTELLRGALDLRGRVGQPFHVTGVDPQGAPIDSRLNRGRAGLIVFWSSANPDADLLAAIERARARDGLFVIGVDLRARPEQAEGRPAGWQHLHDRLGPAHRTARRWGIRQTPRVLVIDRGGRLAGIGSEETWESLLATTIDSNSGGG